MPPLRGAGAERELRISQRPRLLDRQATDLRRPQSPGNTAGPPRRASGGRTWCSKTQPRKEDPERLGVLGAAGLHVEPTTLG